MNRYETLFEGDTKHSCYEYEIDDEHRDDDYGDILYSFKIYDGKKVVYESDQFYEYLVDAEAAAQHCIDGGLELDGKGVG